MKRLRSGSIGLALIALLGLGCGGGGGGGGSTPTGPMAATRFTADGSGTNAIAMSDGNSGSGTLFRLEVRASGVTGLYGAAFDIEYPAALLNFNGGATEGAFLSTGAPTTFNVVESPNGSLIIAVSRLGNARGVDGSGVLLSLDFTVVASGDGEFRFTNRGAFGPNSQSKPNLSWIAGSITTVR